jgi:hypothetical protein
VDDGAPRRHEIGEARRAPLCLLTIAVASLLVLAGCGGSGSTTARSSPGANQFDHCLVGTWTERTEADVVTYSGLPVQLSGGSGTKLTFSANGVEHVDYKHAQPLTGPYGSGQYVITTRGTVVYDLGSAANVLDFGSADFSHFSQSTSIDGRQMAAVAPTGPTPVNYQCTSRQLTQTAEGFNATYSRS